MVQTEPQEPTGKIASLITGALDWWRDAGVDLDFVDQPVQWLAPLAEPAAKPAPFAAPIAQARAEPPPPSAAPIGGDPAALPDSLAAFQAWWLSEPSLDDGQVRDRVPPRGPAGAELMVLVPQPEAEDRPTLLSGREGRLLESFLAAAGIAADRVYCASALVRHTPLPDWPGLAERGLGRIVHRHIALVAPRRLLVFGGNILPLLGHDMTQNAQILPAINHEGGSTPALAARELGALLARPAWKAGLWRNWLDWTGS